MHSRAIKSILLLIATIALLIGCTPTFDEPVTTGSFQAVTGRDLRIVTGQTLYVPAYSEVLLGGRDQTHELVVTLAVHNTDLDAPIILQSVRYHDTDDDLVRSYVTDPIEVSALATTGFLVEAQDTIGGWGSNFIVEWVAEEPVSEPIVEAIMVSRSGSQGISLISLGRVIAQNDADSDISTEE
ncbi:MAG: DUF3124 domain-containing protein [Chloroflexota bacterium]